nr:MAG TPA: hypothetical protein [Caudoviricetes sp.]
MSLFRLPIKSSSAWLLLHGQEREQVANLLSYYFIYICVSRHRHI